jgi:hypothetical protein
MLNINARMESSLTVLTEDPNYVDAVAKLV